MKVATVDIGTNSMRLLIADYENNEIFNRRKYVEVTRIGKGVDEKGMISGEAINLNSNVLEKFINLAKSKNCEKITKQFYYTFSAFNIMRFSGNKEYIGN